jgi:UDP-glucose 4-epimerase
VRVLVTGSSGHLGEALMRRLPADGHEALGLDVLPSPYTQRVGSIVERAFVHECMRDVDAVVHAATLHKPHVATHGRQDFIDVNVTGTLNLLEEAVAAGVRAFVFTSTTSVFSRAATVQKGAPAAWITEEVAPAPSNIYGVTKLAAESLCELFHLRSQLSCVILRTARFFPEQDDRKPLREAYDDANLKLNELLYRRVDLDDVVSVHLHAIARAPALGFGRYIVSATTPFTPADCEVLGRDAPGALARRVPGHAEVYASRGWRMLPSLDRVYVNARARSELGWRPQHDFSTALERVRAGDDHRSALARAVGAKGYHARSFADGPYPVE